MEGRCAMEDLEGMKRFYRGKRVLVTGHTGFKGAWLSFWLREMGAEVWGYALKPSEESLFSLLNWEGMHQAFADIREQKVLEAFVRQARAQVVFHLAAQPLVKTGYEMPAYTYETNTMGTVYLLEALRKCEELLSVGIITTDKVYAAVSKEAYREESLLDGYDPYANSKSCAELVAACYKRCFFPESIPISVFRAGNVIGGGDFAADRLLPDCVRSALKGEDIWLRHPFGIRPYQHVLEPLSAYLYTVYCQSKLPHLADSYNIAPKESSVATNGEVATLFCRYWGEGISWKKQKDAVFPKEADILRLNGEKIEKNIGWKPKWSLPRAVAETVAWTKAWRDGNSVAEQMRRQISVYEKEGYL